MNTSLYSLATEYRIAAERLADLDMPDEVIADTLEGMSGAIELKAQNVAFVIRNMESFSEQIKAAEEDMAKRRKALDNRAARIRAYLLANMQACGITKIECPQFKLAIRENPESVVIDSIDEIPSDYLREVPATYSPDKILMKKAMQDGFDIPGAHLTRTHSLSIK